MLTSGAPQRRQSEGNRVANRLSATLFIHETSNLSGWAGPVSLGRIWSSLLLKTNLLRPSRTVGASAGRIPFSIKAGKRSMQRATARSHDLSHHLQFVAPQSANEQRLITPAETSPAAYRTQEQARQQESLRDTAKAGAVALEAPAFATAEPSGQHGWNTSYSRNRRLLMPHSSKTSSEWSCDYLKNLGAGGTPPLTGFTSGTKGEQQLSQSVPRSSAGLQASRSTHDPPLVNRTSRVLTCAVCLCLEANSPLRVF